VGLYRQVGFNLEVVGHLVAFLILVDLLEAYRLEAFHPVAFPLVELH
jgi:hypothetical protein